MSMFRTLNLRYLRRQPLRVFLAVLSIAGATAGVVAGLILVPSLDRSLVEGVKGMSLGAPIRVVGPLTRGGVDPSALDRVAATEGVGRAVPVVMAVAVAQRLGGDPVFMATAGVDCRIEAVIGAFGCDARAMNARSDDGPAVVSAELVRLVGRDGDIRTNDGRVPIEGAVVNDALDDANQGRIAVFDLRTAQRVFDRGTNYDAVLVVPEQGVDESVLRQSLERALGPSYTVLTGDEIPAWMTSRGPLIPLLGIGLLIALGLSGLLVFNIVSLSLADRRRDLAVASAIGASPGRLTAAIILEATIIGLAGGVVGCLAGPIVAKPLVDSFASVISTQATGIRIAMHIPLSAMIAGLVVGALVGAASSLIPARRAVRIDLASELHGRASLTEDSPRRSVRRIALLFALGAVGIALSELAVRGGALEPWQPPVGALALLLASIMTFAAVGAIAPMLLTAILRFARDGGGSTRIAMANLISRPRRTSVIATAVGSAVGLACVLGALIPATRATILRTELAGSGSDVSVATLPLNNSSNVDARPSRRLLERLERVPGVERINLSYSQEITDADGVYSARAFGGVTEWPFPRIRGDVSNAALERGETIVGTSLARARGLRPGSTLHVSLPTGRTPIRVAGVWTNSYDNGFNITLSPALFADLFGRPAPHFVNIDAEAGVGSEELARRIRAADIDPDVTVRTSAESADTLADEIADQASPFWMLQRVLLLVALVGTLSTLLLVGVQRRRELGVFGAVGFTPAAIGRMTLTEALAACLAGGVLGAIGSLVSFEALRNASAVSIGVRTSYHFEPLSAITATALAAVVVAVGAAMPAWRAARVQIVEAIRDE